MTEDNAIRSAITICLVEQARKGPFVYHNGLADGCAKAAELGFDAVEVFAPSPDAVDDEELKGLLEKHGLSLAAVGTGGGWLIHKLCLVDADASKRTQAKDFIRRIIDWGGPLGAPAIIGSMQGNAAGEVSHGQALEWLAEALDELGNHAAQYSVPLLYEPLNRYETNLVNRTEQGVHLINQLATDNVKLLSDLFHMNIEEADIAEALGSGIQHIGHIHFVDSNRRAAGMGHMDHAPIAKALIEGGYKGYLSAEAFPLPDADATAKATIESFRKFFR